MFKTKELEYFYYDILQLHQSKKEYLEKLKPHFEDIDLSIHLPRKETYRESIKLLDKYEIYLTWNISDLILYIQIKNEFEYFDTYSILNNPDMPFNEPIYLSIAEKVKKSIDMGENFTHVSDFIIIECIPFFSGGSVIDGNHKLFEAAFKGIPIIKTYVVYDIKEAHRFLQPESQKLMELFWDMNSIISGVNG